MLKAYTKFLVLKNSDEGASMVEYAMLVVLIAVVAMVAVRAVGDNVDDTFTQVNTQIDDAQGGAPVAP